MYLFLFAVFLRFGEKQWGLGMQCSFLWGFPGMVRLGFWVTRAPQTLIHSGYCGATERMWLIGIAGVVCMCGRGSL